MEYFITVVIFGFFLILAGIFDIRFLLNIFSYHNLFREIFGHSGLRVICVIIGTILIVGAMCVALG